MPGDSAITTQKLFDIGIETVQTFRKKFGEGRWGLATLCCFSFSSVLFSISYAQMHPGLQSRKTDVIFDHLFFVSDIPSQVQSNAELKQAAYKASIHGLIQALFVYSNETARHPKLLKKIESLLGDYCAEVRMPRHPFFDRFNDEWHHCELTNEQRTSYLSLLSFACCFSGPILRFDEKGVFDEPLEDRLTSLLLCDVDEVGNVLTGHLQKLSSGVRDAFLDCIAKHLADLTLPLHFLGQRLYSEGRGILNAEQKFKILKNLIPAIEAIKQQYPALTADKYSTIEEPLKDWGRYSSGNKRLLWLFRDLESYKTDFKELSSHFSNAPSQIKLPRVPSEPGLEMVSLARVASFFGYSGSSTPPPSSNESSDDESAGLLGPDAFGLRQRHH